MPFSEHVQDDSIKMKTLKRVLPQSEATSSNSSSIEQAMEGSQPGIATSELVQSGVSSAKVGDDREAEKSRFVFPEMTLNRRKKTVITVKNLLDKLQKNAVVITYDDYTVDCENQKDVREAILWAVENQETEFLSFLFKQGISIQSYDDDLLEIFVTSLDSLISRSSNDTELQQKPVRTLLLLLQNGLDVSNYGQVGWRLVQQFFKSDPVSRLLQKVKEEKIPHDLAKLLVKILIFKGVKLNEVDISFLRLDQDVMDYCRATQDGHVGGSVDWAISQKRSDMLDDIMVLFNSVTVNKELLDRVLEEISLYKPHEIMQRWFVISCKQKLYSFAFELAARGANIYLPFDANGNTLLLMMVDQVLQGDKAALASLRKISTALDLNIEVTVPDTDSKMSFLAAIVVKGKGSQEQTVINRLVRSMIFAKSATASTQARQLTLTQELTQETIQKTLEVAAERDNIELIDDLIPFWNATDEEKLKYQTQLLKRVVINPKNGVLVWLFSIEDCLLEPSTIINVLEKIINAQAFKNEQYLREQYSLCVRTLIDLYKQRQQATQLTTVTSEPQLPQTPVKYDALSKLILPAWDQDRFKVIELLVEGGADIDYVVSDDSGSLLWQVAQSAIDDSSLRAKLTWLVNDLHANPNLVFPRLLKQNYKDKKPESVDTILSDIESLASNLDKNILKEALIFTAQHGFTKTFQQIFLSFFTESTDVNAVYGKTDMTLLMLAAQAGDNYSVMELLQKQADPRLQDKHGMTALMYTRKLHIAIRIQNASNTFDIKDNQQKTALIHFIINNCSLDMLQEHLAAIPSEQCAAYVKHIDGQGMTALQYLVQCNIHIDVTKQIKLLMDCGAEVGAAITYVNTKIQNWRAMDSPRNNANGSSEEIDSSQNNADELWGDLEWHQRLEALQTSKPDNQDTMSLCL